jgi:hypothetical protein
MLARLDKRFASAVVLAMMSGALWACGGDDTMSSGTGGSGGSGGSTATGGTADSGKDAAGGDASPDARPDSSAGGSGGTVGAEAGIDVSVSDGAGDARLDVTSDARTDAPPDATPDTTADVRADAAPDARADASPDGSPNDGAVTSDGATTPDVVTSDGNDGATPPPPNDGGSQTSDASEAAVPPPADSGLVHAACVPIPGGAMSLFSFDTTNDVAGWEFQNDNDPTDPAQGHDAGPVSQADVNIAWNNEDGCPTAGQLRFTIHFDFNTSNEIIQGAVFDTPIVGSPDWTGRTAVHFMMKVETAGGLQFINPYAQLGSIFQENEDQRNGSVLYTAENLGVGVWRDVVLDLPAADAGPITPSNIGFQVFSLQPQLTQVVIDSVWLE